MKEKNQMQLLIEDSNTGHQPRIRTLVTNLRINYSHYCAP
jgi:hypothetical protein